MKIIVSDTSDIVRKAAEHITALLEAKPEAVLLLSTGKSTRPLYAALADMCADGRVDFSKAKIFSAAEIAEVEEQFSLRAELTRELINKINMRQENVFFLDSENFSQYDTCIADCGGIDLAVLGIGMNGHIAYNEPSTQFDSQTHLQRLWGVTRKSLAPEHGNVENAVTVGIGTIASAKDIILLGLGEEKADIIFKAVYGRTDGTVPAAFLQLPRQVSFYLDEAAAAKL